MNLWFNYPLSKCVRFMEQTQYRLFGHVFRLGPVAFMVVWRKRNED